MIEVLEAGLKLSGRTLLDGLNMTLPDAGLYTISGPTASGKSLLGRLLGGQLAPQHGQLRIDGSRYYRPFSLNRPSLWYWDALSEPPAGVSVEEVLQSYLLQAAAPLSEAVRLQTQLHTLYGISASSVVSNLSPGERALLHLALATVLPLRLLVLDGHFSLLDSATAEDCVTNLMSARRNPECFLILIGSSFDISLPESCQAFHLEGGLPVRLAASRFGQAGQGDLQGGSASYLRVLLRGGRPPQQSFLSGTHYRVAGLLERGLRIELLGSLAEALQEMEGQGLSFQSIDFE